MEFMGETVEQAIEKAKHYFGKEEIEYEIVSEKKGLLRNEVIIRAWVVSPESVAKQLVESIVKALGKSGSVYAEMIGDELRISLDGDDLGILIGKHGSFIDTLEGFVRYIIRSRFPEVAHVDIDVMGYKQRRLTQLEDKVKNMVDKVRRLKKPSMMPPMLRWERREVHRIVGEKYPDVESKSLGNEPNRRIQITPKGRGERRGEGNEQT
ncbi:KH domain-containing protein [Coprothermobacteraceae bacterium]|nr:KH domain-containing protein [Coprothermobacteraceae bacterium]